METLASVSMNSPSCSSSSPSPLPNHCFDFNRTQHVPIPSVRGRKLSRGFRLALAPSARFHVVSCSAVAFSPSQASDSNLLPNLPSLRLRSLIAEFQSLTSPSDRLSRLLNYSSLLPAFPETSRVDSNRVMGCTSRVWVDATLDADGTLRFFADSDSEVTRGLCACLVSILNGGAPEEILKFTTEDISAINAGLPGTERSRGNTWHNVLISLQKKTKKLIAERDEEGKSLDPFPSLVISSDGIQAKGSYAEAQARFLNPDESVINELVSVLKERKIGVVAHFYMDPEVQGVLTAAQKQWPHIHISDSLVMADSAVKMAKEGCEYVAVLGVDFMSENVRAILDQAGYRDVGVYRMSSESIGCSLADAASSPSYMKYLEGAASSKPSLHVIYINTSLETKAYAHELVPTITCTSSNVVQTILQAFAQIPDLNLWYGPDSYMGANIGSLFQQISLMSDEEISDLHPAHDSNSIKSLLPRLNYFQDGTCIVHHLFNDDVVEKINEMYCDSFLTAHLEVPGEMFSLAMEAKKRGMGVVGSTQNILDFIKQNVKDSIERDLDDHLQFILGTESGMITSIVAAVKTLLANSNPRIKVEIVFPVSSESISKTSTNVGDLMPPIVPGVAAGEGCSLHGGCASCPYMKMNSLSALLKVCRSLPDNKLQISAYEAERFKLRTATGKSVADVGCQPILHMRHFQATKELPLGLVRDVTGAIEES